MCISASASIGAFLTNLISCIALVYFGNKELSHYNYFAASLLIFVSLMQIIDYGIWKDLDCSKGFNRIATIAGPILNFLQPIAAAVIIYAILKYTKAGKELYETKLKKMESGIYKHFSLGSDKLNFLKVVNILYVILLIIALTLFYLKANDNPELLCSTVNKDGNLKWNWYHSKIPLLNIFKYT